MKHFCNTPNKHAYFSKPTTETSQKNVKYVQSFLKHISFYIISLVLKFYKIMINSKKERKKERKNERKIHAFSSTKGKIN